eukprot:53349-Eustigmatos_ZCMA.PRE.1
MPLLQEVHGLNDVRAIFQLGIQVLELDYASTVQVRKTLFHIAITPGDRATWSVDNRPKHQEIWRQLTPLSADDAGNQDR